jgi:hypothetical protein
VDQKDARAPIAQLDRALASGAKGQRFESSWAHQFSGRRGDSAAEVRGEVVVVQQRWD